MKAIILAAGRGKRLEKYTSNLPKGMLNFNGMTLIERQIKLFKNAGINDIIVVRGFEKNKINYKDISYVDNDDFLETNILESFLKARNNFNSDVIVSYADIIFEQDMVLNMIKSNKDFVVAVDINWKKYWLKRYGNVQFDTESLVINKLGNISSIGTSNASINEIDARYIGLLRFSKYALKVITNLVDRDYIEFLTKPWQSSGNTIKKAYMTDLIQALINENFNVYANKFRNGWLEFDTNEDYEKALTWLKSNQIRDLIKF